MNSDENMHQLLPWYVTDTLRPEERRSFAAHLPDCESCQSELPLLESIRDGADRNGAVYLSQHCTSEEIVEYAGKMLSEADSFRVRQHVAQCPTCSLEVRWVTGDTPAGRRELPGAASETAGRANWTAWATVAAAVIVALSIWLWLPTPDSSGLVVGNYLSGGERGSGEQLFSATPDETLLILAEADLAPNAFPISAKIIDSERGTVVAASGISKEMLIDGRYVSLICSPKLCPDGSYRLQLEPSEGDEPPVELRFRVERSEPFPAEHD